MMQCHFCVNLLISVFGHTVLWTVLLPDINIHPLPVVLWNVLLPDIQHSPLTCGALECFTARHTTFTPYLWCFGMFNCQTYNIHPLPVVLWKVLLPDNIHPLPEVRNVSAFSLFFVCSPDLAKIYCGMQYRVSKIITNCSLMILYNTFTECVHSLLTMYGTFKDKNTTPY